MTKRKGSLVLHNLQKSCVSAQDWSLLCKPSRKELKEKERIFPHCSRELLWKPSYLRGLPGPALPAFIGSPPSCGFGLFPAPLNETRSPADLHSLWAAQSLPRPPLCGARGVVMLTWGWGATGFRAGTLSQVSRSCLGHSLTLDVELNFFECGGKDITGFCYCLHF